MPMTQEDIRSYYETQWRDQSTQATSAKDLAYSSPVEDAVLYPAYEAFLADHRRTPNGARILDVGSGSGRWVRFFLSRFTPASFTGIDFAASSVELLRRWSQEQHNDARVTFQFANIADPTLNLGAKFDLINIANVLFHIPEQDLFEQALRNLRAHVETGGAIVTTEYLPRDNYRTEWMLVRSRYAFEESVRRAGLRIAAVRSFAFFSNDPMGLDGPDSAGRAHFNNVRACMQKVLSMSAAPDARDFFVHFFAEIERATLAFARERVAEIDMPSQKLVMLVPA